MTLPPDMVVRVTNECGKMLDDLVRRKGVSLLLTMCNDNEYGSFGHWWTNTNHHGAQAMARRTYEEVTGLRAPTKEQFAEFLGTLSDIRSAIADLRAHAIATPDPQCLAREVDYVLTWMRTIEANAKRWQHVGGS